MTKNTLHLSRSRIDSIFTQNLTKDSMREIEKHLKQMLFNIEDPSYYYLDVFYTNIAMLKKLNEHTLNKIKMEIYSTFKTICDMITAQHQKNIKTNTLRSLAYKKLCSLKKHWPKIKLSKEIEDLRKKYSQTISP